MWRKILLILICIVAFFLIDFATAKFLHKGLERYFGMDENAEILLLGHSHLMLAADKEMLEDSLGCKVAKYCREGVDVKTRQMMLKHYLSLSEKDSLKVVIYGVDQYMFNPNGLSENVYKLFYPFMDNQEVESFVKENAGTKDFWMHKLIRTSGYSDGLINSAIRGWMCNWSNYKIGAIDIHAIREGDPGKQLRPIIVDEELKHIFEESIDMLTNRGVNVVLLNTPIIKEYNDFGREKRDCLINYLQTLSDTNEHVYYWDLNPEYAERYDLFFDPIHINNVGQPIITKEIINLYRDQFLK